MAAEPETTPVQSSVIIDLTSTVSRLDGKLDEGFGNVKERLSNLEGADHLCKQEERIEGLFRWRTLMLSFVGLVAGAAVTFAISSSVADATHETELTQARGDIDENKDSIKVLEDNLHTTKLEVIKAVQKEAATTREAVTNGDDKAVLELSEEQLKRLRPYEQRTLKRLVSEAKGDDP